MGSHAHARTSHSSHGHPDFPWGNFPPRPGLNQRQGSCSIDFLEYLKVVSRALALRATFLLDGRPRNHSRSVIRSFDHSGPATQGHCVLEHEGVVTNEGCSRPLLMPNDPLKLKVDYRRNPPPPPSLSERGGITRTGKLWLARAVMDRMMTHDS